MALSPCWLSAVMLQPPEVAQFPITELQVLLTEDVDVHSIVEHDRVGRLHIPGQFMND